MTYEHTWFDNSRWPPAWNVSGETIPARAVVQVSGRRTGPDGTTIFEVTKPDGTGTVYAANGPIDVQANNPLRITLDWPASVLAGAVGTIGPVADSWAMGVGGSGFTTIGAIVGGEVLVSQKSDLASILPSGDWYIDEWNSVEIGTPIFPIFNATEIVQGFATKEKRNENLNVFYDPDDIDPVGSGGNFLVAESGLYLWMLWHRWGVYSRGGFSDLDCGVVTIAVETPNISGTGRAESWVHHPTISSEVEGPSQVDLFTSHYSRLIAIDAGTRFYIQTDATVSPQAAQGSPNLKFFVIATLRMCFLGSAYTETSY